MQKDIPRKTCLETLSFILPAKTTVLKTIRPTVILAGRTELRVSKNFFRGYLFVFVEYLSNRSPKIKTKNVINYNSILTIVNHRNWLDDSPPLRHIAMWNIFVVLKPYLNEIAFYAKLLKSRFRVLKPKSRDLLLRNLVQTYNSLISNCVKISCS